MRLNAALVQAGLARSRRKADELISAGQVRLNGQLVNDFSTAVHEGDELAVAGRQTVLTPLQTDIILFNKPIGYTCTHRPQRGQKTIFALLPAQFAGFKLAGRLDIDSEGLVILSNNGEFIQQLSHPSAAHAKSYRVMVREQPTKQQLAKLSAPLEIMGHTVQAAAVQLLGPHELQITINQGLNRQVRRMCGRVGLTITRLQRTQLGPYRLGNLPPGQWRLLHQP